MDITRDELITFLRSEGEEKEQLFKRSEELRNSTIGSNVHLRGLVEISNICMKECYYCGIRNGNSKSERYRLSDEDILKAAKFAYDNNYGSLVLQGGESTDKSHVLRIDRLLKEIKQLSNNQLGVTLSLGEQSHDTYRRWFESGAHRFLLRIESSNRDLYYRIHPNDQLHNFEQRLECLDMLKDCGYQTGTGVMIGLPTQTVEDLADDLLFFKKRDVDMVGMGPYIEHKDTPLYSERDKLLPLGERLDLALKMIASLRLLMSDINIAAATALQAIDPFGREKALKIGANIIMPNITPTQEKGLYTLYNNKPSLGEGAEELHRAIEARVKMSSCSVKYGEWGDSLHYRRRNKSR